jgi:CDP-4-dehydro-6-deoxyglucose reductase
VHCIYEALCKDLPVAHFMLCGWRPMVDEAKERIIKLGYNKTDVEFELYG